MRSGTRARTPTARSNPPTGPRRTHSAAQILTLAEWRTLHEVVDDIVGAACDLLDIETCYEVQSERTETMHCLNARDIRQLEGFMAEAGVTEIDAFEPCWPSADDFACELPEE